MHGFCFGSWFRIANARSRSRTKCIEKYNPLERVEVGIFCEHYIRNTTHVHKESKSMEESYALYTNPAKSCNESMDKFVM